MISALIADDEQDIVALVKKLIVYPHVKIIAEAYNGLDAYSQICEKRPDLVIMDIRMPGMSGLEVIEKAMEIFPDICFVVISGYHDFEYVQSALRLGVSDYLLKPIKKTELNDILQKIDLRLQNKSRFLEKVDLMQKNIDESRRLIRKNYVQQSLHSISEDTLEIPQVDGTPVFVFGEGFFQCLLVKLDEGGHLEESVQTLLQESSELIKKAAVTCCREVEFIVCGGRAYFLLNYKCGIPDEEINDFYKTCENLLKDINYKFSFIRVAMAASQLMPSQNQIRTAYKQAEFVILDRLEKPFRALLHFDKEREAVYQNEFRFKDWSAEKRVPAAIERLSEAEIMDAFQECWNFFVLQKRIPGAAFEAGISFVNLIHSVLQPILPVEIGSYHEYGKIHSAIDNCFEAGQIKKTVLDYIKGLIGWCGNMAQNAESRPVRIAKVYVEKHYAEGVTLEDVAKHVCLSPTYFSSLFKSETGCGFLNYLQNIRIDHAKKLLRESNISIGTIAGMVGYADIKYFSKLFVKETGIKPSAYRKFYL